MQSVRLRTMRRRTLRARRRLGTELLELGLILGLILLPIIFGTIEFGTYFYVQHNLQAAAREGARAACVLEDQSAWADAAQAAVDRIRESTSLNQFQGMQIECSTEQIEDASGKYVAVTVKTTWDQVPQGLRPMLMIRNPEGHELKAYAAMRWEADPAH